MATTPAYNMTGASCLLVTILVTGLLLLTAYLVLRNHRQAATESFVAAEDVKPGRARYRQPANYFPGSAGFFPNGLHLRGGDVHYCKTDQNFKEASTLL